MQLHIELRSTDTNATELFLRECMGWITDFWTFAGETYVMFKDKAENPEVGGDVEFSATLPDDPTCVVYCPCDDIEELVERSQRHGATVYRPIMPVGDHGLKVTILKIPGGAHLGFWWMPKQA